MPNGIRTCLAVLLGLVLSSATAVSAAAELVIMRSDQVAVHFDVAVASDSASRARGLMFRSSLPPRQGMWFDFEHETEVVMWMKNTVLALDMIFVAADGEVRGVHEQAQPYSLTHIRSPQPVRYVLELNGGEVARYGIALGDRVLVSGY